MEILSIPVKEINPAAYNPRKDLQPGDPEYEKLKKSILEFDMVEPLVWNRKTGNLVGGHQRLKILIDLGIDKVDVSVVELSLVKEKALNIALNKIQGEWDFPRLKDLLQELDTGDFDMEITGFDVGEIENLMTQLHVPEEGLTQDDAIPQQVETICKTGDLRQLGNHRLLCGDATKQEDVERLMGGEKANMVFTDPPYGVEYEANLDDANKRKLARRSTTRKYNTIFNDDISPEDLEQFLINVLGIIRVSVIGPIYLCYGTMRTYQVLNAWFKAGLHQSTIIVWKKNRLVLGRGHYHSQYESIMYGWASQGNWHGGRDKTNVWEIDRPSISALHPTMKPVALCIMAIENSSQVNDIVADFFGGSGSTLIACEKLDRRCFMMEIDEHYCDVIIQRWQDFTGLKAEKLNGN